MHATQALKVLHGTVPPPSKKNNDLSLRKFLLGMTEQMRRSFRDLNAELLEQAHPLQHGILTLERTEPLSVFAAFEPEPDLFVDEVAVGIMKSLPIVVEGEHVHWVPSLYVPREHRENGIGTALIREIVTWAQKENTLRVNKERYLLAIVPRWMRRESTFLMEHGFTVEDRGEPSVYAYDLLRHVKH